MTAAEIKFTIMVQIKQKLISCYDKYDNPDYIDSKVNKYYKKRKIPHRKSGIKQSIFLSV